MYHWRNVPLKKFKETAESIRNEVEQSGYNKALRSYTLELNGTSLDASALTFSLVGYCDAGSERMISTMETIYNNLSKDNLIYRYQNVNDGLRGEEGSFGACNYWYAENLARAGQLEKAIRVFENMQSYASPTGLLSEEIDPVSGDLLGNYPQGFTHIALVNAALAIDELYQKQVSNRKRI